MVELVPTSPLLTLLQLPLVGLNGWGRLTSWYNPALQLRINFNITMLALPCEYASVDVLDLLGTNKVNMTANIVKVHARFSRGLVVILLFELCQREEIGVEYRV